MTIKGVIIALIIHLIIPLIGLLYFLSLKKQMKKDGIQNPPTKDLFIIFATYGGLLLLTLTAIFWKWSGMASLGVFYLLFLAPIAMIIIAYRNRMLKTISKYHKWSYFLGLSYFVIAPIAFWVLFSIE